MLYLATVCPFPPLFFCPSLMISACLFPLMCNRIPPGDCRWRRALWLKPTSSWCSWKCAVTRLTEGKLNLELEEFQQCSDGYTHLCGNDTLTRGKWKLTLHQRRDRRAGCEGWCRCTTLGRDHLPLVEWPVEQTDGQTRPTPQIKNRIHMWPEASDSNSPSRDLRFQHQLMQTCHLYKRPSTSEWSRFPLAFANQWSHWICIKTSRMSGRWLYLLLDCWVLRWMVLRFDRSELW